MKPKTQAVMELQVNQALGKAIRAILDRDRIFYFYFTIAPLTERTKSISEYIQEIIKSEAAKSGKNFTIQKIICGSAGESRRRGGALHIFGRRHVPPLRVAFSVGQKSL